MTRRNNNRNKASRSRRPSNKPRNRSRYADRAVLPPAKTLMGHVMRSVVQTAWDIAQGALQVPDSHSGFDDRSHLDYKQPLFRATPNGTSWTQWNIDIGWLLAQGWLDRFKGLFKEVKVHRITAHYMPYEPVTSRGEYVFALWDRDQDAGPSSFAETIGAPASVVRKNGQPARLVWYPTEPEDRNWHQLNDNHIYCSTCLFQAESAYNVDPAYTPKTTPTPQAEIVGVEGKIVIDVDASFRGKPVKPTVTSFQKCTCRRCIRVILSGLTSSLSGSTSPFLMEDITSPGQSNG